MLGVNQVGKLPTSSTKSLTRCRNYEYRQERIFSKGGQNHHLSINLFAAESDNEKDPTSLLP